MSLHPRRAALVVPLLLLLFAPLRAAPPDSLRALPPSLPHHYGVIGIRVERAGPDTLRVDKVRWRSPAARAGLRPGDLLLGVAPYRLRTPEELSRCIQSFSPGSRVRLLVERRGAALELRCTVTEIRALYALMGEEGKVPGNARAARHRRWNARTDSLEEAALALVRSQEAGYDLKALRAALRMELGRYDGDSRLQDLHFALLHPLKAAQVAGALAGELRAGGVVERLERAAAHLDLPALEETAPPAPPEWWPAGQRQHPFYRQVLQPFWRAGQQAQDAFAALSAGEQDSLFSHFPLLLERFSRSFALDEGDSTETRTHIQTLRLAKRVDLGALFAATRHLVRHLSTPAALKAVRRAARRARELPSETPPAAFGGTFLYARHTPWGWILVGGEGANFYGGDAALIVDLGGDDTYFNNAGAPTFVAAGTRRRRLAPAGLLVDFGGDDRYLGFAPGAQGAGTGGIGLLLDLGGDDLYQAGRLAQGAAFCGVGVLWDRKGRDVYLGQEAVQGAAFFGAGLLIDEGGRDLYSAAQFGQGFGGTRGLGLLSDSGGDDRYLADRKIPSSYGTEGLYRGWSQGVGCGFRGYSSGGIGLLLDSGGDDEYQAGNFSQGTGYFFGLGLLFDREGDDRYLGSRYAQGAGAHQALGVLLDKEGDDRYLGKVAASQGSAWDAAVALLLDLQGDDHYEAQDLAQGAAAMNGLALLFDAGGRDVYQSRSGQGAGQGATYWGGRRAQNLGLLIDDGGADVYSRAGRANHSSGKTPGVGLFLDR